MMEQERTEKPETETLGPGTAGHATTGAAYRGHEVAANRGLPMAEERGFPNRAGGGKLDEEGPA